MTAMRRVVVHPDRIAVEAAEVPAPLPRNPDPHPRRPGVCGSDLHAAHGRHPFVTLPYLPGHEVVRDRRGGGVPPSRPGPRASESPWSPTCPAGCARCAPPAARTCARTCSSSAAATARAAWRITSRSPPTACIPYRTAWTITPRRSSSRCPRLCTPCAWPATSPPGRRRPAPARSGCSPWPYSARTGRETSSAPIRIPPNAPGPRLSAPTRSSTHAHPTSPGR